MSRSARAWAVASGAAAFGLFLGHQLNYLMLPPVVRAHVMSSTGHGYLATTFRAAAFGALLTGIVLGAGAVASGYRKRGASSPSVSSLAARLIALQAVGFIAIEVLERAFSGAVGHHLDPRLLAAGVAIQALVGGLAALTIAILLRVAHDIGARLAGRVTTFAATSTPTFAIEGFSALSILLLCLAAPRGPPAAV